MAEEDIEAKKAEEYGKVIKNSKTIRELSRKIMKQITEKEVDFKPIRQDMVKIREEQMKERIKYHGIVMKAQGDEGKELELMSKMNPQKGPRQPLSIEEKRARGRKMLRNCCCLIGICYSARSGYLKMAYTWIRSQLGV
jgi:hypothetical protein